MNKIENLSAMFG